jgi:hypothetical protein
MSRVRNTASSGNKGGFTLFLHALARHEIEGDGAGRSLGQRADVNIPIRPRRAAGRLQAFISTEFSPDWRPIP